MLYDAAYTYVCIVDMSFYIAKNQTHNLMKVVYLVLIFKITFMCLLYCTCNNNKKHKYDLIERKELQLCHGMDKETEDTLWELILSFHHAGSGN